MSEEKTEEKKPGLYLVQFTKVTSQLGEQVTITKNLPAESTEEEIGGEIAKMGNALWKRMLLHNEQVKARAGKSLEELGIDTGSVFQPTEE